jgi:Protein of unknown function (DUF3306)
MNDPEDSTENFMQRWSRRKRAAKTPTSDETEPPSGEPREADASSPPSTPAESEAHGPAFDITTLPPIDSITATSDVRAFLAAGVPEGLTRAALRRAWMIDPTIRDFVGLAENQWDFTKPDGVPGFGSLELTPELRRIAASVFGDAPGHVPPAKAEQDERVTEISTEFTSAMTTPRPGGSDAELRQPNAANRVVTSATNPEASFPVPLQDGKNDAVGQGGAEADKA